MVKHLRMLVQLVDGLVGINDLHKIEKLEVSSSAEQRVGSRAYDGALPGRLGTTACQRQHQVWRGSRPGWLMAKACQRGYRTQL